MVWQSIGFPSAMAPVRDANRLTNGNILITGTNRLVEFTPTGELAWRLILIVTFTYREQARALGFFDAVFSITQANVE